MDFIQKITSKFKAKYIKVKIDDKLNTVLGEHGFDCNTESVKVPINLFDLIYSIGLVTIRREATNRPKLNDFAYLLEYIKPGRSFLIKISGRAETQVEISEQLGVGISIQLTKKLFNVSNSTISPIHKTRFKTMDFSCASCNDKIINVEAKGTINRYTRNSQISDGILKKDASQADVKVISATLLKETGISDCIYLDPPIISPDNPEYKINLMKADHYARVFNLLGQKELSKYFYFIRKRIIHDEDFREFPYKQVIFDKLKNGSIEFNESDITYVGNIYKNTKRTYQFIGFDKKLISIESFLNFNDYSEEKKISYGKNKFYVTRDGICLGYISNINDLPKSFKKKIISQVDSGEIKHIQEYTTMVDIDSMNYYALNQYFEYIFNKLDLEYTKELYYKGARVDYTIDHKNNKYLIEVKKSSKKIKLNNLTSMHIFNSDINKIFITNQNLTEDAKNFLKKNNTILIDRNRMKNILFDIKYFLRYLEKIKISSSV